MTSILKYLFSALAVWFVIFILLVAAGQKADAHGFPWFFAHIHPSGQCGAANEVAVSYYWEDKWTASGERFRPKGLTAAHRTWAFGTKVHLRNPHNGRTVTVRVNDRGPYPAGISDQKAKKMVDISIGAARALGMDATVWLCEEHETREAGSD